MKEEVEKYLKDVDGIAEKAYASLELTIHPLLSKNPYETPFWNTVYQNRPFHSKFFWNVAAFFWIKSFILILLYLLRWAAFKIGRTSVNRDLSAQWMIDTFALVPQSVQEKDYKERYFKSVLDLLEKNNTPYAVWIRFFGSRNPVNYFKMGKIFKKDRRKLLCEFDLVDTGVSFSVIKHIVRYPFAVRALSRSIREKNAILAKALISTLHYANPESFMRFYMAQRISRLLPHKSRLISWYENQVIDKLFFKGIDRDKIIVYGAQLLLQYPAYFSLRPSVADIRHGSAPDILLVNGKAYLEARDDIEVRLGVSLRYGHLFTPFQKKSHDGYLILLPYMLPDSMMMLRFLGETKLTEEALSIRAHPALDTQKTAALISPQWHWANEGTLAGVLEKTGIVITTGSGTAMEAAVRGASVIIIANQEGMTTNPMPDKGKGEIWDIAETVAQFDIIVSHLSDYRRENPERIRSLSQTYRDTYFVEPTEENIKKAFDIS